MASMDHAAARAPDGDHSVVNIGDAALEAACISPSDRSELLAETILAQPLEATTGVELPQAEIEADLPAAPVQAKAQDAASQTDHPAATETVRPSIFRVPASYRKLNPDSYTPAIVTFGPFHHDTANHLLAMEAHKRRAVELFLSLMGTGRNINEETLVAAVRRELPQLMQCYAGFDGISCGDDEYVASLMLRYYTDDVTASIVRDNMDETTYSEAPYCDVEKLVCGVVRECIEEFARRLLMDVDVDEFTRLMVKGDDTSRLMVRHIVSSGGAKVRDDTVSHLMLRHNVDNSVRVMVRDSLREVTVSSLTEQFVYHLVREGVEVFARKLVRDGVKAFARLLVRDGIFLISTLIAVVRNDEEADALLFSAVRPLQFPEDDPIFGNRHMWPLIRRDMLLIENQIPLRVILILLGVLSPHQPPTMKEVYSLGPTYFGGYKDFIERNNGYDRVWQHMLGLYRHSRVLGWDRQRTESYASENVRILYLKGIMIKQIPGRAVCCYDDFFFKPGHPYLPKWISKYTPFGTLYIPTIDLNDQQREVFLNLMALERLQCGAIGYQVTVFLMSMAKLVREPVNLMILETWYRISLSTVYTKEDISSFFQEAWRGFGSILDRREIATFTWNPIMWIIMSYRFMLLLVIEDRGRLLAYIALFFAISSWVFTLAENRKYRNAALASALAIKGTSNCTSAHYLLRN